ncbi:MAG: aldo/keto reductase [Oscillospiraceae bacterium]|nr:aldo/keto reductase [Oscillospiraceae bacterium]
MDTIILGKTGLRATIAGLGCGGFSRIGIQKYGVDHAAGIVRTAYDEGVNFFDTAAAYGTEGAVGQGLAGLPRDSYILSTKYPYRRSGDWRANGAADLMESLENSLRELRTDHVDIYHLHGVTPEDYADARDILLPAMIKAREQGKLRFLGITELFGTDTSHEAFKQAVPENLFDVIMVGYNMLNPSAAKEILPKASELNTGVLCMFAVRSALSNQEQLVTDIGRIIANGQAGEGLAATKDALDFLVSGDAPPAASVMEAAYRFCRHTPPIHVGLTGTSDAGHLR